MRRKYNENIYYIAAVETIIRGKNKTYLGDYTLEYQVIPANYYNPHAEKGTDIALCILVRMRNNETYRLEWGDIYYKPLVRNKSVNQDEAYAQKEVDKVIGASLEEQVSFILKPETKITKRPYAKTMFLEDYDFFDAFKYLDGFLYPHIKLGGRLPIKSRESVEKFAAETLRELSGQFKGSDKVKKI